MLFFLSGACETLMTSCDSLPDLHGLISSSSGVLRSLECAENWIAVGNYNGWVNTLDYRTGDLLTTWKPGDTAQVGKGTKRQCRASMFKWVGLVCTYSMCMHRNPDWNVDGSGWGWYARTAYVCT